MKIELKNFWLGLKAAIIASSCCSFPVALVYVFSTLGVGSMTAALKIPRYKWFFVGAGTLFLLVSLYYRIKKERGMCRINDVKKEREMIIVSLTTYVALTLLLIYLILPLMAEWLFGA